MSARHHIHMSIDNGWASYSLTHEGDDFTRCGTWPPGCDGPGEDGYLLPQCFLIELFADVGIEDLLHGQINDPTFPLEVDFTCTGDGDAELFLPAPENKP